MVDDPELGAALAAVVRRGLLGRTTIAAHADGLVIARGGRVERVRWTAIDAVVGGARGQVQVAGRVVARVPDDDDGARVLAIAVARAGLVWLPAARRAPAMAVRPAVAARAGDPAP